MPSPPRFPLFPPDLGVSLSGSTFRALRRLAAGALDDVPETDRVAIASALFSRRLPADAADLLDDVARFGDETARDAILEAAIDRSVDVDGWVDKPAVDVGARLALRARKGKPWSDVAARVRVRLGRRFAQRAWYDVRLALAAPPSRVELVTEAARRVHGERFVRVLTADTEDGARYTAIVHRGPGARAVDWAGSGRARLSRPYACDFVRWDASEGLVSFSLARPFLLTDWKDALAAVAGAPLYASRLPFTLKLLHERGATLLAHAKPPAPVLSAEVVACELDDGKRFGVRGTGALSEMHARLGHGGYVYRVTLRFVIDGARRQVDATIELPDKLLVAEPRWESAIRAALTALGLTEPGAIADDLASLAPFVHPEWRWSALLGAAGLARAVARSLLVRARTRKAGEPRHRMWGSMYTAHDLEGETEKYAVADDPAARAHTVKAGALAHLRLDVGALATALREELVLAPCAIAEVPRGVLPIGTLVTKSAKLVFFLLAAVVPETECAALREAVRKACTRGQTPVVLVGRGRSLHGGIAEIEVSVEEQVAGGSVARVVAAAAAAAGIEDEIEHWRWGTPDAPLVLVREAREAWLGRVKLDVTAGQLAAIEALAHERGAWMTPLALGQKLSPRATWHDQIARKTLADFDERVARSFAEAGVALPEGWAGRVIEMKKGKGYRMGVGVVVR
jgi:hypothetical protein